MAYPVQGSYQPYDRVKVNATFVEGLRSVENSLLINIIAGLLTAIVLLVGLGAALSSMSGSEVSPEKIIEGIAIGIGAMIAVVIIALILLLVAFAYLYRGMNLLAVVDPQMRVGSTGIKLSIAGVVLMFLGFIAIIAAAASESMAFLLVMALFAIFSLLLILAGNIMLLVAFWRLGEMEDGSLIHIGLILVIIGALLSLAEIGGIFWFIGIILLYLGVRNLRQSMESKIQVMGPQGPGAPAPIQPGPY